MRPPITEKMSLAYLGMRKDMEAETQRGKGSMMFVPYASLESAAVFPSSDHPVICCKNSYVRACVLNHFSRVLLFVTPCTVAHQVALSMGFPWQECWTRLPFPSPGYLPNPGIEPVSPALQTDTLPSEPFREALNPFKVTSLQILMTNKNLL